MTTPKADQPTKKRKVRLPVFKVSDAETKLADYRRMMDRALSQLSLARTYALDGAPNSAADIARDAARLFDGARLVKTEALELMGVKRGR